MHPADIIAAIHKLKKNQRSIAAEIGRAPCTVGLVIHGRVRSRYVAQHISSILQTPVDVIWPGGYDYAKKTANGRQNIADSHRKT